MPNFSFLCWVKVNSYRKFFSWVKFSSHTKFQLPLCSYCTILARLGGLGWCWWLYFCSLSSQVYRRQFQDPSHFYVLWWFSELLLYYQDVSRALGWARMGCYGTRLATWMFSVECGMVNLFTTRWYLVFVCPDSILLVFWLEIASQRWCTCYQITLTISRLLPLYFHVSHTW